MGRRVMITGVAIRLRDGTVHSLPKPARHHQVMHAVLGRNLELRRAGYVQGFVTDGGDFLDRYEARDHAVACRQVLAHRVGLGLFSEDLW